MATPTIASTSSVLHDYVRARAALDRVTDSVTRLRSARSEISVVAGEQRKAVAEIDAAILACQRAAADTELVIRHLGRSLGL